MSEKTLKRAQARVKQSEAMYHKSFDTLLAWAHRLRHDLDMAILEARVMQRLAGQKKEGETPPKVGRS